jgi:hypothetical protein
LGSMISVRKAYSRHNSVFSRLAGAAIVLLFLSACGPNQVIVEGKFPAPLMSKVPLTIGIWYPPEFRNHEFTDVEKPVRESKWIVKTGEAQVQMWSTVLDGMFRHFVEMEAPPGSGGMNEVVDAILIPHVDELQYAIPTQTHVKVYEIWMRYRFELVTQSGEPIAQWMMTAYGKTPTAFLQSDTNAVNLAAVMALRDAGANFVTGFIRVPELAQWRNNKLPKAIEPQP